MNAVFVAAVYDWRIRFHFGGRIPLLQMTNLDLHLRTWNKPTENPKG